MVKSTKWNPANKAKRVVWGNKVIYRIVIALNTKSWI